MSIPGLGSYTYSNYSTQYQKNSASNIQTAGAMGTASSNLTLHIGSEDSADGKALGAIGFPDGSSTSVFKGEAYTEDNPVFKVKTWDAEGNVTEALIDASKVDPYNATLQEMMVLNANRRLNGEETFEDGLLYTAGLINGDGARASYRDFFTKADWVSKIADCMDMQYQLGNMEGYLRYKKAYEILKTIDDEISDIGSISDRENVQRVFSKVLEKYAETAKEKIEKGETEPKYQIGGQSFTEKEWNQLIEKMDKAIDEFKAEQKERIKKQDEERELKKDRVKKLFTDYDEIAFKSCGPIAPEEVKKAWIEAAKEAGCNGAGIAANGKATHITAMAAERAVKWLNGDPGFSDILGGSVETAISAAQKALNDLENPLQPINTRNIDVQKQIAKEKDFYNSFLEKLKKLL